MANIAGNISWGIATDHPDRLALKGYLRIEPEDKSEDPNLEPWFNTAIQQLDIWLDNPFVDDAGDDLALPEAVRLAVHEYVKVLRERYPKQAGTTSVKTGQLAETYGKGGKAGAIALAAAVLMMPGHKIAMLLAGAASG